MIEASIVTGFILLIIVLEIRDYRWGKKFKLLQQQNNFIRRRIESTNESLKILSNIHDLQLKLEEIKSISEKSLETADNAKTNLDIIVNEYEINGIWLGKDRISSKNIHAIEG